MGSSGNCLRKEQPSGGDKELEKFPRVAHTSTPVAEWTVRRGMLRTPGRGTKRRRDMVFLGDLLRPRSFFRK